MDSITIKRPDDWHLHIRDQEIMEAVLPFTSRVFARAIIMPNLAPPVVNCMAAQAYRDRIIAAIPEGHDFTPLMTLYLTDKTDPDDLAKGHETGLATAAKLYPANATTNSSAGVTDIGKLDAVFKTMASIGMPLLIHGEVTDRDVDIYDREAVFIERILKPLAMKHPDLKIVLEHITTSQAVDFVMSAGKNIAATITPHHLTINRSDMFKGGIRPHLYCLPIAKREQHRLALRAAATSGNKRFFLGTDSAPHARTAKESDCGCAGIFNAPSALETYAEVFEQENALDKLEAFASLNGPGFYGLPENEGEITLAKTNFSIPDTYDLSPEKEIVPFRCGENLTWSIIRP